MLSYILNNEYFWLFSAFLIVLASILLFARKKLLYSLDLRIQEVETELKEAIELKKDATSTLHNLKIELEETCEKSEIILANAQKEAKEMFEKTKNDVIEMRAQHAIKSEQELQNKKKQILADFLHSSIEDVMKKIASDDKLSLEFTSTQIQKLSNK